MPGEAGFTARSSTRVSHSLAGITRRDGDRTDEYHCYHTRKSKDAAAKRHNPWREITSCHGFPGDTTEQAAEQHQVGGTQP